MSTKVQQEQPSLISKQQELFSRLSAQYKSPLRNIMSETEEVVQTTITNMINQMIALNNMLQKANTDITRLQKLCTDNKINFTLTPLLNRAQRRKDEQLQKKKKNKNKP